MAQNGLGRVFLCRSCRTDALTPLSPFSTSARHGRIIPRFSPSSTPELDDLFKTFRAKIFTPGALSGVHRDLIRKPSRHKILLKDPGVTVTMSDEEEVKLQPIHKHEIPKKRKSLQRLSELLRDTRDWQNLPAFLEGMKMAKQPLPFGYIEKLVRRANEQGRTGIIIRCAEMVKKTGVTLADPAVTTELMLGIHLRAAKSGFKGEDMDKAIHQAQVVALLLKKEEHQGRKPGQKNMAEDLTVLGIMLELRAAQPDAAKEQDVTLFQVEGTASTIMALWRQQDLTVNDNPHLVRSQLEGWLPLWAGMKLALDGKSVKDSKLRSELEQARDALTKSIEQARQKVEQAAEGRPRRCLQMYSDLKGL